VTLRGSESWNAFHWTLRANGGRVLRVEAGRGEIAEEDELAGDVGQAENYASS